MNHTLNKMFLINSFFLYDLDKLLTRTVNSLIVGLASARPLTNSGNIFVFNKSAFNRPVTY